MARTFGDELLVGAASDLAAVQNQLAAEFQKATGHTFKFVLQSSGMLARQIRNGAPYDVYLSANEQYVKELAASGDLDPATVAVYAVGRLGLWSKGGSIRRLEDLLGPGIRHIAIANPAHAPYGVAAKEALEKAKLWSKLEPRIVLGENVRQALQYGESGNADAVLTSWTMVWNREGVLVAAGLHNPIRQAGGVLKSSTKAELARRFLEFLKGPAGQAILVRNGLFSPVP